MMQDKVEAMIYAYSLGCLGNEDLEQFHEYLASGEDFNFAVLGEIQNLTALIPCALHLEEVNPALKDSVARRLYGLRNDIKKIRAQNKIKDSDNEESQSLQTPLVEKEVVDGNDVFVLKPRRTAEYQRPAHDTQIQGRETGNLYTPYNPQKEIEEKLNASIEQADVVNSDQFVNEDTLNTIHEENIKEVNEPEDNNQLYKGPSVNKAVSEKKSYGLFITGFLLFFIIIVGVIYIYFKLTAEVKNTKREVDNLKGRISSLTMQLSSNQEIQQMLQSPNVVVVNLKGTDLNRSGYGKLIISQETGRGYIQLAQMPALKKDHLYILWLQMSGNFIQLGSFAPTENLGYYSFNVGVLQTGMELIFLVTEESSATVKNPGYKVFLTGSL